MLTSFHVGLWGGVMLNCGGSSALLPELWAALGLLPLWSLPFCRVHAHDLQLSVTELGMPCCRNTTFCSEDGQSFVLAAKRHTRYK